MNVDAGYDAAKSILEEARSRLVEITTEEDAKIQVINRILTEALGWNHKDISAERKHENGFSDYVIHVEGNPAFLIEAKRVGVLDLKTKSTTRGQFKISGPVITPAIGGVTQAASYSLPEGIPLCLVTDGVTWIVFLPWTGSGKYTDKEAIVFPTINSVLAAFTEFYELLSKEHVQRKTYRVIFDSVHQNLLTLDRMLAPAIDQSENHIVQKSALAFDLEAVFAKFFSNLTGQNDPDMLAECFVETRESRIADFSLEKLTKNVLGNVAGGQKSIDESLKDLVTDAVASDGGQTVFIVGPTGAGKSTFLDRFFSRTLAPEIRSQCLVIKIDVQDATGDGSTLLPWLTEKAITSIESQLYDSGSPGWDELFGLYHLEYVRRSKGADARLYDRDKEAFKDKFSDYMNQQVEQDREGYLRRLLKDIVVNRKRLPVFIIDNTDEFSMDIKTQVFQYVQALQRYATNCLIFFPSTDRSAWAFSKTDIFNIYSSRSYFLPTPPPREVFRKRVDFLRSKTDQSRGEAEAASYIAQHGITVKIPNIAAFASVVEAIFVEQDYPSKQVGELANYNMRKSLDLAKRVITSSVLNLEDLVRSYITSTMAAPSIQHFSNALVKGDYSYYKPQDEPAIFPVFQVDKKIKQSPLTNLRLLQHLSDANQSSQSSDDRYVRAEAILSFFDAMSITELATQRSLEMLLEAGLIEPYDLSRRGYSDDRRFAITFRGMAHLRMAKFNPVFFEQMALTTPLADSEVSEKIRNAFREKGSIGTRLEKVRELFAQYLNGEDSRHCFVPERPEFSQQAELGAEIQKRWVSATPTEEMWEPVDVVGERLTGKIEKFDKFKGFGFVELPNLRDSAFLHIRSLEASGIEPMPDPLPGDSIECEVTRNNKGLAVSKVVSFKPASETRVSGRIVKLIHKKRFGFAHIDAMKKDAFFHFDWFTEDFQARLHVGMELDAAVVSDEEGQLQLRRIY
jgi:cold shock CspA family protein/energy-coupling factor transporter ATP-binding protein EcfA2